MAAFKIVLLVTCAYGAMGSSEALAQSVTAPATAPASVAPPAAAPPAQPTATDEIVVTANKREENLNKVGLTITAVTGQALSERKITSLADIASLVPGLTFASSPNNTPIFTLRGIGFNESSLGVYPAVSVYIDQVPLPFPVLASHTAYDLQRVEVLKGPQGTLFGQNSTGGAINYIAAKPTDHFEAGGDLSYGRFNQVDGNAYVSGPLTDRLRGRIAITGLNADGWQYSVSRPYDRNGKQSYLAGRLLLDWDPTDRIRFSLNANAWRDRSEPQAGQLIAIRPQDPANVQPQELVQPFATNNDRSADWSTGEETPRGNRRFYQIALTTAIDLTDDITVTALTSYVHFKQDETIDSDGSALVLNDLQGDAGKIHSFNQEVRVANSAHDHFRWVIGGNYEKSVTAETQRLRYFDDSVDSAANFFIDDSGVQINQSIRNYAIFANGEYDILPRLTVRGGVRYTNSRNSTYICGYSPGDGNVANLYNFLGTLPSLNPNHNPFTPIGPNDCYTLNNQGVPGTPFTGTLQQHNVSWRGGLDYHLNSNTLLYGNISRGYKAGSFPALAAATFAALQPVTQESVTAYEAGFKATLLDHHVQLNAAGFYYDYKNKQIRGKTGDPIFGILDVLTNIPKSSVAGGEADLTVRPFRGLSLTGSITYLASRIKDFTSYNVLGNIENFSGSPLPLTPKWNGSFNAEYRYELPSGGAPFAGLTTTSQSSSDASPGSGSIVFPASPVNTSAPGLINPFVIKGYTTVDARLGYEAPGGRWRVMVWGKNIFNKYYWTNAIIADDAIFRLAGRPATYGITFGFKFD